MLNNKKGQVVFMPFSMGGGCSEPDRCPACKRIENLKVTCKECQHEYTDEELDTGWSISKVGCWYVNCLVFRFRQYIIFRTISAMAVVSLFKNLVMKLQK